MLYDLGGTEKLTPHLVFHNSNTGEPYRRSSIGSVFSIMLSIRRVWYSQLLLDWVCVVADDHYALNRAD